MSHRRSRDGRTLCVEIDFLGFVPPFIKIKPSILVGPISHSSSDNFAAFAILCSRHLINADNTDAAKCYLLVFKKHTVFAPLAPLARNRETDTSQTHASILRQCIHKTQANTHPLHLAERSPSPRGPCTTTYRVRSRTGCCNTRFCLF